MDFPEGGKKFSFGEGVSPVQLSSYMINQNVVINSIAIDHKKIENIWDSFFHDPYVCCLIIPSDTYV